MAVPGRFQSFIYRMIALFSPGNDLFHLIQVEFSDNFFLTVGNLIFSRHQYNLIDKGTFLKSLQGIIEDGLSLKEQILFLHD